MSTFTMPLKRVIEFTDGTLSLGEDGISRMAGGNIGLGYYPIWNNDYRPILNGKIIDHYMNREIAHETIDMFQLAMRRKMNEIMPIYNQLYETTQIEYDPLSTIDITTINNVTSNQVTNNTGTSTSSTDSTARSRSVNSETPQTMLSGNEDYASNGTDANSQSDANSTANEDSSSDTDATANGETTVKGFQGIAPEIIASYRANLLNIDLMIINDLSELFMQIWDTGDSYTNTSVLPYPYPSFIPGRMIW